MAMHKTSSNRSDYSSPSQSPKMRMDQAMINSSPSDLEKRIDEEIAAMEGDSSPSLRKNKTNRTTGNTKGSSNMGDKILWELGLAKEENEASFKGRLSFVHHPLFEAVIILLIILNAIQMGVALHLDTLEISQENPMTQGSEAVPISEAVHKTWDIVFQALEQLFTTVFAAEMALKIYSYRLSYFMSGWNIADFVLAWVAIFDNWILFLFVSADELTAMTAFRLVRLLRVTRLLRVVRLRGDLLVLVEGIAASLRAMVPIMTLLMICIYAFSLVCVEVIGKENDDYTNIIRLEEQGLIGVHGLPFNNKSYFGKLSRAWITLFNMAILAEWPEIIRPVFMVQSFFVPFLMLFIMVTAFGIINVIIGVIVEQTEEASLRAKESERAREKEQQMETIREMVRLICSLDDDSDGCISTEEFEDPALKQVLAGVKLPHGFSSVELYTMLDKDGSGEVTLQEFISGMYRMIHCNEFQKSCLMTTGQNHIKKLLHDFHAMSQESMRTFRSDMTTQLQAMYKIQEDTLVKVDSLAGVAARAVSAPLTVETGAGQASSAWEDGYRAGFSAGQGGRTENSEMSSPLQSPQQRDAPFRAVSSATVSDSNRRAWYTPRSPGNTMEDLHGMRQQAMPPASEVVAGATMSRDSDLSALSSQPPPAAEMSRSRGSDPGEGSYRMANVGSPGPRYPNPAGADQRRVMLMSGQAARRSPGGRTSPPRFAMLAGHADGMVPVSPQASGTPREATVEGVMQWRSEASGADSPTRAARI